MLPRRELALTASVNESAKLTSKGWAQRVESCVDKPVAWEFTKSAQDDKPDLTVNRKRSALCMAQLTKFKYNTEKVKTQLS